MPIGIGPRRVKQASQNEQAEEPEEEARVEPGANRFKGKNRSRETEWAVQDGSPTTVELRFASSKKNLFDTR